MCNSDSDSSDSDRLDRGMARIGGMRSSIHIPYYLANGLIVRWREKVLVKKVLATTPNAANQNSSAALQLQQSVQNNFTLLASKGILMVE